MSNTTAEKLTKKEQAQLDKILAEIHELKLGFIAKIESTNHFDLLTLAQVKEEILNA